MSAPNKELAEALTNAESVFNYQEHWDSRIKSLADGVIKDTYDYRAPQYSRNNYTVAGLLAFDGRLRTEARDAGIDVREFDNILGQVAQLMLTKVTRVNPAVKVANALRKLTGL